MRKLTILFVAFCLYSCEQTQTGLSLADKNSAKSQNNLNHQQVPGHLLNLQSVETEEKVLSPLEENLFGKFFSDRVEFFIVENPTNQVQDSKIESIVMCYLDGRLGQVKYKLEQNIVDRLIKSYGSFRIEGYDDKNRALIKSNQIVAISGEKVEFNKLLDNYELRWDLAHAQVSYKVNINNQDERFVYMERLKDFKTAYKSIKLVER